MIERDRHDVARAHRPARSIDAQTVEPDEARGREVGRRVPRAHDPRVPQPLVDSLPLVSQHRLALEHDPESLSSGLTRGVDTGFRKKIMLQQ